MSFRSSTFEWSQSPGKFPFRRRQCVHLKNRSAVRQKPSQPCWGRSESLPTIKWDRHARAAAARLDKRWCSHLAMHPAERLFWMVSTACVSSKRPRSDRTRVCTHAIAGGPEDLVLTGSSCTARFFSFFMSPRHSSTMAPVQPSFSASIVNTSRRLVPAHCSARQGGGGGVMEPAVWCGT